MHRLPRRRPPARAHPERAPRGHRRLHLEAAPPGHRAVPGRGGCDHDHARRGRPARRRRHRPLSRREGNTMAKYLFAVWDGGGSAPPELAVAAAAGRAGSRHRRARRSGARGRRAGHRQPLPTVGAGDRADQPAPGGRPHQGLGVQDPDQPVPPRRGPSALRTRTRLRGRHRGRHRGRAARRHRVLLPARGRAHRRRGRRHPLRPADAELLLGPGPGHAALRVRVPPGRVARSAGSATEP